MERGATLGAIIQSASLRKAREIVIDRMAASDMSYVSILGAASMRWGISQDAVAAEYGKYIEDACYQASTREASC